jgi:MFS family permease
MNQAGHKSIGVNPEGSQAFSRLIPMYVVIFAGFVGYSLMITVFTPLLLRPGGGMLPDTTPAATRSLILGGLLALYPLGQFLSSPIMGSLSDRHGRRPAANRRTWGV